MKNKSDLKRKVLCSLLAASTMGIFYSSDAMAASVNGVEFPETANGVITDDWLVQEAGSKKFVIAQGDKLAIATEGNVNSLLADIQAANGDLTAIRKALADHSVVGVIGGEGQLDTGLRTTIEAVNDLYSLAGNFIGSAALDDVVSVLNKIDKINTITETTINQSTDLIIGEQKPDGTYTSPVVIGMVGGDLSVNTGLNGSINIQLNEVETPITINSAETSIIRNGNINNTINSGNVIGGVGGSTAVTLGNISGNGEYSTTVELWPGAEVTATINVDLTTDGKTTTTINGNVNTAVNNGANIGAFANGGAAMAIGGEANSIITGNTNLKIDSAVLLNDKTTDGVTAGVAGGGTAITTIGGTANSTVEGSTTINVQDGLVIGATGGGIAAAVDATGVAEGIVGGQLGNNEGYSDITGAQLEAMLGTSIPDDLYIKVDNVINGGTATATTGDTNIGLMGSTTAVGTIGGGIAVASHTYTVRPENEGGAIPEGQNVNDAYGSSTAKAESGKTTIVVDLITPDKDAVTGNLGTAVSGIVNAVKGGDLSGVKDSISGLAGQGAAVGIIGGGVAFGQGSLRGSIDDKGEGALATATTNGADIDLQNGYAAGVFGGGAAVTLNNAKAEAASSDVNIRVGEGMKAIGIFGGGLALSMEGERGTDGYNGNTTGTLASSSVNSSNIEINGDVDGAFGGGMAIGNSNLGRGENINDAVANVGTSNITVNSGTIDNLNIEAIMDATKNDNTDTAPWWSSLGMNASMAMNDLKGITDGTSIAAGGLGMGMTGSADVETANVIINGGTIKKDILGGGIAVDNMREGSGAHVGTSTITLNGGTVEGSVYAGGAVNKTTPVAIGNIEVEGHKGYNTSATSSTVGTATVVLNGATVNGEISGQGYESITNYNNGGFNPYTNTNVTYDKTAYDSVDESTLVISGNNTLKPLDENGDYVGESKIHSFDNVNVTADSVTTLVGLTAGDTTALIDGDGGVITVANGAKLDISQLKVDKDNAYLVATDYAENSTLWNNSALAYDRTENYAQAIEEGSEYKVSYKDLDDLTEEEQDKAVNDLKDSLGESGEHFDGIANGIIRDGANTFTGAKDFFSDYTTGNGTTRDLAAMAMIGEAAGVTAGTISVAGDMADNSVLRLSFTQDNITGEPKVNEDGAIWAKYIHNKHDLDDMASSFGSINSSSDFDGATIGVDFAKKGKVQSGIAFSYGDGDSHGMGINNDFDMWGVTLYGNVKNDDSNVIADIGFSESDNELTGNAMGKRIKADRDVSVFTVGVRAEKLYTNGNTQIVPYTGLRYYNVDPDSYTAYYDGAKFGEYDADRQNIWTLPLGVSLRNETVTENGWRLTPKVDVAYIWAFGDTDNSFDLNTGSGVDNFEYTVMDSGSWLGSVGFEAGKGDWNFGLGYSYQKGSHAEANKWFVNAEYSF